MLLSPLLSNIALEYAQKTRRG